MSIQDQEPPKSCRPGPPFALGEDCDVDTGQLEAAPDRLDYWFPIQEFRWITLIWEQRLGIRLSVPAMTLSGGLQHPEGNGRPCTCHPEVAKRRASAWGERLSNFPGGKKGVEFGCRNMKVPEDYCGWGAAGSDPCREKTCGGWAGIVNLCLGCGSQGNL